MIQNKVFAVVVCFLNKSKVFKILIPETCLIATNLPQSLTQDRSWHAEVKSEVKSCQIPHPEAKIKETILKSIIFVFTVFA